MNYEVNEDFLRDNPDIKIYGEVKEICFDTNNFTCKSECDYDNVSDIDTNNNSFNCQVNVSENNDYVIVQ